MAKNLCLLVGCSGSGKTTIAELLESKYGYKNIQSYTTRPKRADDETGHIFITKQIFDELKDKVAYTKYDNYEYCATAKQVDDCDVYVIDPRGVEELKRNYRGDKPITVVYITTRLRDRYERMRNRGNTCEESLTRIINDVGEFKGFEQKADYIIRNDDCDNIEFVVDKVKLIIEDVEMRDIV